MKYKIGDRIVVFDDEGRAWDRGVITAEESENEYWARWDSDEQVLSVHEDYIALEIIADSPLFKALS